MDDGIDRLSQDQLIKGMLAINVEYGFIKMLTTYDSFIRGLTRKWAASSHHIQDADDIYQDATIAIYNGLNAKAGDTDWYQQLLLQGWIYRVARNAFLRYIERYHQEAVSIEASEDVLIGLLEDDTPGPEAIQHYNELLQEVKMGIETLKEKYRQPLLLRLFDQLSYAEIAEQLGIEEQVVKIHLFRGKRLLWKFLATRGYGE